MIRRVPPRVSVLAVLVAVLMLGAGPAAAHADLVSADPSANSRIDAAPDVVRLTFSEPIEPAHSDIRLRNLAGEEIAAGGQPAQDDPFTLELSLAGDLPDDVYTVAWRVVSAADGHESAGRYTFGIGMAAGSAARVIIDESVSPLNVIGRWLDMAGAALTLGVAAFATLVWRPGLTQGLPVRNDRLRRAAVAGWVFAGAGLLVGLSANAAVMTGSSFPANLWDGSASGLLGSSAYGTVWLGRAGLWVILGAMLAIRRGKPLHWGMLSLIGLGLAVLPSLVSHARALGSADAVLNDMLHRTGAALWVGGLAAWIVVLLPAPDAMLLAVGGLFAALQQINDGGLLTATVYGRAAVVKGILFTGMFALAGFNVLVVEPRLKRGIESWPPMLRMTVGGELILAAALFVVSAVMASGLPAVDVSQLRAQADASNTTADGAPYFGMGIAGDVMVHLEVLPGRVGANEIVVSPFVLSDSNRALTDATRVQIRAASP
ncbi:MAG: hypothetical protein DWB44_17200, partial [Chloroflexi bacterium]|nr:hypothetical protein [Chloroflexota bacterium]